ncbi:hypothetical protein CPLU01_03172 [Colletotrichum plurivorum]|uniref:Uncharacterized protein n=1 Tax=Colletotrichum plurivorum TaxID=2175906 RepID=A0A8H6KUD1_9PEZI|nr:hypothetical protein CPLU01_03172 [Colletotrichum plurivorum]
MALDVSQLQTLDVAPRAIPVRTDTSTAADHVVPYSRSDANASRGSEGRKQMPLVHHYHSHDAVHALTSRLASQKDVRRVEPLKKPRNLEPDSSGVLNPDRKQHQGKGKKKTNQTARPTAITSHHITICHLPSAICHRSLGHQHWADRPPSIPP